MSVKKKNKDLRKSRIVFILIMVLAIAIIAGIVFLVYLTSENYINYGPENKVALSEQVESVTAKQAKTIVLNNVLLGAVKDTTWVGAQKMYDEVLSVTPSIEINMYSKEGRIGTFETARFKRGEKIFYTKTTKLPEPDDYIAVQTGGVMPNNVALNKITTTEEDVKNVKKALGKYKLLNSSVKIVEAYQTSIVEGEQVKLYSVTSSDSTFLGVYSAIVCVKGRNAYLIKYAYVKDTELSSDWPVYSIKYVIDLNLDGKAEIILQETTATKINYLVEEYIKNMKFNEVLKVSFDI
ncbi:MAG: hypothetical protein IKV94_02380 [Clostridia bacterium]|nr:hypothetical protein [Clostridia bacterium]